VTVTAPASRGHACHLSRRELSWLACAQVIGNKYSKYLKMMNEDDESTEAAS